MKKLVNIEDNIKFGIKSSKAKYLNIETTGLGAYFDDACKSFLNTQNNILYLQAIGR